MVEEDLTVRGLKPMSPMSPMSQPYVVATYDNLTSASTCLHTLQMRYPDVEYSLNIEHRTDRRINYVIRANDGLTPEERYE